MAQLQLYIFHTGRVRVDRAIPLHERNPLAVTGLFRGKDKQLVLPVSAYLIVHPNGKVLIDTGWDTIYATQRPRQLLGMVDRISAPIIAPDEGIDSKLRAVGLAPADLDHVYISHMDFDHASGLRLVRGAKDIRTAEEEWAACNRPGLRYVDTWTGICKVGTFAYRDSGIGPVGRSFDVFGDGALLLVHTPGHSHGLFSALLRGKGGYIVLGNDAAYLPESFSRHRIPGFTVDNDLAENLWTGSSGAGTIPPAGAFSSTTIPLWRSSACGWSFEQRRAFPWHMRAANGAYPDGIQYEKTVLFFNASHRGSISKRSAFCRNLRFISYNL